MNIRFLNAEKLIDGINLLSTDLNFTVTCENADFTIALKEINEDKLLISLKNNCATISYNKKARFFRGLAYAVDWFNKGFTEKELSETPLFKTNGAMFDMSRNAVMNLKSVKMLLRKMALMGLNTFMLYTEDTYEIKEYPYFGHLRGRYSKEEIRELDAYAIKLGIELIPCIQTLGHLATHLRWDDARRYKDGASTLLVGNEETYKLIDAMFRTIKECYTSRRIHLGMDETFDLGTGNYLETYGYKPRDDIYLEHVEKVRNLALKHGIEPMIWSDMFFRHAGKNIKPYEDYHTDVTFTPEIIEKIPKGVQPVFWDYYHDSQDWYDTNIKKHQAIFTDEMIFAGGVWIWTGHCPLYSISFNSSIAALNACKENNVKNVMATAWLNGPEGSHVMALAGIAWFASFDYNGGYDLDHIKETFRISCDASYDEMMMYEMPEKSIKEVDTSTRAMLYNDPFLGIADKHLHLVGDYFKDMTNKLSSLNPPDTFKPATNILIKLCSALENKGDFGLRLKDAYDKKDNDALKELLLECDIIIKKIMELKEAHRISWFTYNKPFGWEVFDIRYGGIISRFDTVKIVLKDYLDGNISSIPELEEERLSLRPDNEDDLYNTFRWGNYRTFSTVALIYE